MRASKLGIALAGLIMLTSLSLTPAFAGPKKDKGSEKQTFTGVVTDAMCGAKHMMAGDPKGCLQACVKQGSKYALVVGDKVYTLETSDKAALSELEKLGGEKATVSGTLNGSTIEVSSVSGA